MNEENSKVKFLIVIVKVKVGIMLKEFIPFIEIACHAGF